MTVHAQGSSDKRLRSRILGLGLAGLLGVVAALLVACGSSGTGLIPVANAGPLQSDFEAVAQAAQTGGGNCSATTAAINKTEQDFAALPSINSGLRGRLREGITNLRERALALCAQPLVQTTTTTTPARTTTTTGTEPPTTTPTTTETTTTRTTPTTPSAPTSPETHGGTAAPSEGSGGAGQEAGTEESGGAQAGGQEAGK